jgi:hypothetical protein
MRRTRFVFSPESLGTRIMPSAFVFGPPAEVAPAYAYSWDGNDDLAPEDPFEEPTFDPDPFDDPAPVDEDPNPDDGFNDLPDGEPLGPEPPDADGGNPPFEPLPFAPIGPAGPG